MSRWWRSNSQDYNDDDSDRPTSNTDMDQEELDASMVQRHNIRIRDSMIQATIDDSSRVSGEPIDYSMTDQQTLVDEVQQRINAEKEERARGVTKVIAMNRQLMANFWEQTVTREEPAINEADELIDVVTCDDDTWTSDHELENGEGTVMPRQGSRATNRADELIDVVTCDDDILSNDNITKEDETWTTDHELENREATVMPPQGSQSIQQKDSGNSFNKQPLLRHSIIEIYRKDTYVAPNEQTIAIESIGNVDQARQLHHGDNVVVLHDSDSDHEETQREDQGLQTSDNDDDEWGDEQGLYASDDDNDKSWREENSLPASESDDDGSWREKEDVHDSANNDVNWKKEQVKDDLKEHYVKPQSQISKETKQSTDKNTQTRISKMYDEMLKQEMAKERKRTQAEIKLVAEREKAEKSERRRELYVYHRTLKRLQIAPEHEQPEQKEQRQKQIRDLNREELHNRMQARYRRDSRLDEDEQRDIKAVKEHNERCNTIKLKMKLQLQDDDKVDALQRKQHEVQDRIKDNESQQQASLTTDQRRIPDKPATFEKIEMELSRIVKEGLPTDARAETEYVGNADNERHIVRQVGGIFPRTSSAPETTAVSKFEELNSRDVQGTKLDEHPRQEPDIERATCEEMMLQELANEEKRKRENKERIARREQFEEMMDRQQREAFGRRMKSMIRTPVQVRFETAAQTREREETFRREQDKEAERRRKVKAREYFRFANDKQNELQASAEHIERCNAIKLKMRSNPMQSKQKDSGDQGSLEEIDAEHDYTGVTKQAKRRVQNKQDGQPKKGTNKTANKKKRVPIKQGAPTSNITTETLGSRGAPGSNEPVMLEGPMLEASTSRKVVSKMHNKAVDVTIRQRRWSVTSEGLYESESGQYEGSRIGIAKENTKQEIRQIKQPAETTTGSSILDLKTRLANINEHYNDLIKQENKKADQREIEDKGSIAEREILQDMLNDQAREEFKNKIKTLKGNRDKLLEDKEKEADRQKAVKASKAERKAEDKRRKAMATKDHASKVKSLKLALKAAIKTAEKKDVADKRRCEKDEEKAITKTVNMIKAHQIKQGKAGNQRLAHGGNAQREAQARKRRIQLAQDHQSAKRREMSDITSEAGPKGEELSLWKNKNQSKCQDNKNKMFKKRQEEQRRQDEQATRNWGEKQKDSPKRERKKADRSHAEEKQDDHAQGEADSKSKTQNWKPPGEDDHKSKWSQVIKEYESKQN